MEPFPIRTCFGQTNDKSSNLSITWGLAILSRWEHGTPLGFITSFVCTKFCGLKERTEAGKNNLSTSSRVHETKCDEKCMLKAGQILPLMIRSWAVSFSCWYAGKADWSWKQKCTLKAVQISPLMIWSWAVSFSWCVGKADWSWKQTERNCSYIWSKEHGGVYWGFALCEYPSGSPIHNPQWN